MSRSVRLLLVSLTALLGPATEIGALRVDPVLSGPSEAYLGSRVQFHCEVPGRSSPLTFELRKDSGDLIAAEHGTAVTFDLQVTERSEGRYYCRESGGRTSSAIHLQTVIPVTGARLSSDPDPPILYEGQTLVLRCLVRKGSRLSFLWYHDTQEVSSSSGLYRLEGDTLTVDRAGERHAGIYSCMAHNRMEVDPRFSSSRNLRVTVKRLISAPQLSFSVQLNGSSLVAVLQCIVGRGSPPLTFRLLLDGLEAQERREETLEFRFVLPLNIGQDLGSAHCEAQTDRQRLLSNPVRLHLVPVGGAVRVAVSYLHDADGMLAAVRLRCVPDRGTFPSFSWTVNSSSLPAEGATHALTHQGQVLLLTDVGSGPYRCHVRDAFNSSGAWLKSEDVFIRTTGSEVPPMEVVALVFCVFLSLVLIGGSLFMFWRTESRRDSQRCTDQAVQTETITRVNTAAEESCQPQTLEMKTIMEIEA